MQQDIKAKQDYLYTEIIDKNYDPEQFQQYIQNIKGLSLQLYTLAQLTSIVQAFKKGEQYKEASREQAEVGENDPSFHQRSGLSKEIQLQTNQDHLQGNSSKVGVESPLSQSINSSNNVYHEFLLKQTVSGIYRRIYQKKEKVHIKIRSYSKVQQQSFFGSTYISYLIQTPQPGWTVRRRFNDFEWLHAKIIELFPGFPVPPIPKKTAIRSFDDRHLQERMNTFQRYLNKLLNIPQICSEPIFEQFLSVSKDQQFSSCKERIDLTLKNRGNKVITLKGQNLVDKSQYRLQPNEFQFYKTSKELLHSLNLKISSLQNSLKETSIKAFEVSSIFNQFHQHLLSKDVRGASVIQVMSDFVNELGYKLQRQHNFIQKQLQNYWNYEEKYVENILSFMTKINKDHYEMLNKYKSMSNFELDSEQDNITHPSQKKDFFQYQQTREIYRVRLSFLNSQIQRFEENDLILVAREWMVGLQGYMGGVRDLMLSGVDQLTKAQCVAEGKKLVQVEYIAKKGGNQSKKW